MNIKLHQVYKSVFSNLMIEVIGKKGSKFKTRILTEKYGVYAGSHTMTEITIRKQYILLDKKVSELF